METLHQEKETADSILSGLKNNEFKMYLQFIVDNKTKQIVAAEALSRWNSSEKGLVAPGSYIKYMETAGLISRHDFYMGNLAKRRVAVC